MDNSQSLWERYRAMFSLRDLSKNDKAAVMALVEGFKEKESALFRHEIAFVLGQVGPDAACAESDLIKVVEDDNEHPMVRHEAAEALGSIDTENANTSCCATSNAILDEIFHWIKCITVKGFF